MKKPLISWNDIYKSGKTYVPFNKVLLDRIFLVLPPVKTALDIGCGTGELTLQLEKKGLQVTGIDLSEAAIELAKKKTQKATFVIGPIEDYDGGPFDLITCKLVLPFIEDERLFLKKVKSLLIGNGILLLYVPVRLPKYDYDKHYQSISVDYQQTVKLLKSSFTKVTQAAEVFHHEKEHSIIFLCYK